MLLEGAQKRNVAIFPIAAREVLERVRSDLSGSARDRELVRIVIDLIAGMTEQQAVEMHSRLSGVALGSSIDYRLR
jgi:dGTP triphosphohydrolase